MHSESPGDRDTLFLPARELVGVSSALRFQTDQTQLFHRLLISLCRGAAEERLLRHHDVFHDHLVRKEVERLKDHTHLPAHSGQIRIRVAHVDAVHDDRPRSGCLQTVDAAKQCRLTGSRRADDAHDIAFFDIGRDILKRGDVRVFFAEVFDFDQTHISPPPLPDGRFVFYPASDSASLPGSKGSVSEQNRSVRQTAAGRMPASFCCGSDRLRVSVPVR